MQDLKAELIQGQRLAVDEDGAVLVWTGGTDVVPMTTPSALQPASPGPPLAIPAGRLPQTAISPATPSPLEAERRQLTVLFCDLVDSTRLASQLDPEDLREVVRAYQATCAEVIQRFDGHIAQYLGDGLLIYFGYPQAHEDDAQRAVRASLGMLNAMQALNTRLEQDKGIRLAVRLGIHTGLVVVGAIGSDGRHEQLALGETPNIAARLQGLAEPNTVVISEATSQLIQGYFVCQALGAQALKGLAQPLIVYRVLHDSGAQTRLDVAATRGLTLLVGREQEGGLLGERWKRAAEGMGQVVVLTGEAGIGKSRLVQVLRDQIAGPAATHIECRCSPHTQQSALYPVIAHLERALAFTRNDTPTDKLHKLEDALASYAVPLAAMVPLFTALLSLPPPAHYPPLTLTSQRQRQKTLEALLTWLGQEADKHPVLFMVEDLHWVDPSTLEFLSLLMDQSPTARIMVLLTCRPEFTPPWPSRAHLTSLTLSRLPRPEVERMVASVAGAKALPRDVVQQIVAKTDGVPLFVEELTKTVLESGLLREHADHYELTGPLPALAIPATLQDSLMARLDRLSAVKTVAQLGATIGRQFAYDLLQAISPLDEGTLQQGLRQLVEAELLYQRGIPPQATYLFKHALIQDAAYQSLLRSTRQQSHQRIAQMLEARFPELVETQPELLAHHYTEAGLAAPAVGYWQRAGRRAVERSAYVEAIAHLTRGLEVLTALPKAPERTQRELDLRLTLGPAFMALKGFGALEVEQTYAKAYELCQQLQMDTSPQLLQVLYGLRRVYIHRGNLQKTQEISEQYLRLAQQLHDVHMQIDAYWSLGLSRIEHGDVIAAQAACEHGIALDTRPIHGIVASERTAIDPGVMCRLFTGWSLWVRGYPEQALCKANEALTLAQALANPLVRSQALVCVAWLHQYRREIPAMREQVEAAMAVASEHAYIQQWAWGMVLRGWADTDRTAGITQMRQGLNTLLAIGTVLFRPYLLALFAEGHGAVGRLAEGLHILDEALGLVENNGQRLHEAELYRLKGELLLKQSVSDEQQAEACFQQALAIARRQQAKSWELRAATSLSRLWQQQGKPPVAAAGQAR